jgi:hypothetical protein
VTSSAPIAREDPDCRDNQYSQGGLAAFHYLNAVVAEFRRAMGATAAYEALAGRSNLCADTSEVIYRRYYAESPRRCSSQTLARTLLSAALVCVAVTLWPLQVTAHGWYPRECCHDHDCAPVENLTWLLPTNGGTAQLIVTSNRGKAVVPQGFPERESKDGRMHVCMQYDPFGDMRLICLFVPSIM